MNLKWIDNTNKINKLEKMGIKGASDKVNEVKPVIDAKKKIRGRKKRARK